MNIKSKIATAIGTGAIVASALLPASAFADQTCTISGNGGSSRNRCRIKIERRADVRQTNTANVSNTVVVVQNTGLNSASGNTGGSTTVETGNTSSTVSITVSGNTNSATVNP